jgi:hypothetical protein
MDGGSWRFHLSDLLGRKSKTVILNPKACWASLGPGSLQQGPTKGNFNSTKKTKEILNLVLKLNFDFNTVSVKKFQI